MLEQSQKGFRASWNSGRRHAEGNVASYLHQEAFLSLLSAPWQLCIQLGFLGRASELDRTQALAVCLLGCGRPEKCISVSQYGHINMLEPSTYPH